MQRRACPIPLAAAVAVIGCGLGAANANAAAVNTPPVPAQVPAGGVRTTKLDVDVRIVDAAATTTITLTARNDGTRPAEATWVLPLPPGAVADGFTMTMNGQQTAGEVLDSAGAARVYESIVRRRRDPGLLEYVGRGCLRARVFPIPAGEDLTVEVRYAHVLEQSGTLHEWRFPIRAAGLDGSVPDAVELAVDVTSSRRLRNVLSPLPTLEIVEKSAYRAIASFEGRAADVPNDELSVLYSLTDDAFGFTVLTHRPDPSEPGYFLAIVSPRRDGPADEVVLDKTITFVLDTSGSMRGAKIEQAKGSLRQFLRSLRPSDRFNVVPFSTEARPLFEAPVTATTAHVAKAEECLDGLEANGGTNFADALTRGIARVDDRHANHVPITVFLTDGKASVGPKATDTLLAVARRSNPDASRVFVIGVGDDVNPDLLDRLAERTGGARDYVRPDEDIEAKTSALFEKLSHPVLTDVALTIDGVETDRLVPTRLPDVFRGGRLVVVGRFTKPGDAVVRLAGAVGDTKREYVYETTFGTASPNDALEPGRRAFVASLWAERRVAVLLDAIRLNGPDDELVTEVERLGRAHRIVTPYTSHLVLEDGMRADDLLGSGSAPPPPGGGGGAAPSGPGPAGPASPGPSGPATAGPSAPAGPTTGGFRGRFAGGTMPSPRAAARTVDLDEVVTRMQELGLLPKDATGEQARELARRIAQELRGGRERFARLGGKTATGRQAIDDSRYLAELMRGADARGRGSDPLRARLLDAFSRKVDDKVFLLRDGTWTDRDYAPEMSARTLTVDAFSREYFTLVAKRPALRRYIALSTRLCVVLDDIVLIVRDPSPADATADTKPGDAVDRR